MPKVVTLDPAVLDRYVGEYQLAPGLVITITRREAQLLAQLTGQPAFEIYASGEREFFYKVVNAQLVFESDGAGACRGGRPASERPDAARAPHRPLRMRVTCSIVRKIGSASRS